MRTSVRVRMWFTWGVSLLSLAMTIVVGWIRVDPLPEKHRRPFKRVGVSVSLENLKWHEREGRIRSWEAAAERIADAKPGVVRLSVQMRDVQLGMGGNLDWRETERLLAIFARHRIPTILVFGAKNLQWPEEYLHAQLEEIAKQKGGVIDFEVWMPFLQGDSGLGLQWFLMECYRKWGDDPRVEAIQIENEPFEPTGPDGGYVVDDELLNLEVQLAERQVTRKPIVLTMGMGMTDWPHKMADFRRDCLRRLLANKPDVIGFNVYAMGFVDSFPSFFIATSSHWREAAHLVAQAKQGVSASGKSVRVVLSELQAEPWEKDRKVDYVNPYGNRSLNPDSCRQLFLRCEKLGADEAWLWGAEFAAVCAEQGNVAWMDLYKELIKRAKP